MSLYLGIVWTFFKIGLFAFGGGYAAVALILSEVVHLQHWITEGEFLQILTLAEMTPGPIAINTATFVGYRLAGFYGSLAATLGVVLPSLLLVTTAFHYYTRIAHLRQIQTVMSCLRPAVLAILITASLNLARPALAGYTSIIIFALALVAYLRFRLHPILIILLAGITGLLLHLLAS